MTFISDEVAAEEVENREENSVGDEVSCSLPKVYLYNLWSSCVHNPLKVTRGIHYIAYTV